ncbi:hypothetical protein BU25DRAFT_311410, partial [Macroventuria anomochaeta]
LSAMDQEGSTPAQLDQLFDIAGNDQVVYHQNNNKAPGGLDHKSDIPFYYRPPESATPSPAPTPNFSDYNFGQQSSGYPTPGPNTAHSYPIEQQQCFHPNQAVPLEFRQRPQPVRSPTTTLFLQPSQPPPGYARRRSFGQGDGDHIAAINVQVPNPTFMRMQAPRSRSAIPSKHSHKRRAGRHSGSTGQESTSRGSHTRGNVPTSVPYYVNGMVPTHIGTPLSPDRYAGGHAGSEVVIRHMVGPVQMERSQKVIEIGALAVRTSLDTALMKKLEDVERYLKDGDGDREEALKGWKTIREVLMRRV